MATEPNKFPAERVALKLGGPRLIEAADWMLGKPVPEEIDEESRDWGDPAIGADLCGGVLSVPMRLLADFIEECVAGAEQLLNMADDLPPDEQAHKDCKASARALTAIAEKLTGIAPDELRAAALRALHG